MSFPQCNVFILTFTASFLLLKPGTTGLSLEDVGPRFNEDWPTTYGYSSATGGKLSCRASGQPPPTIQWLTKDFTPLHNFSSAVRSVDDQDKGLIIKGFEWNKFRPEIHAVSYRCRASNSVGSVVSPEIRTRPVPAAGYKIEINDVIATRGNTAVLRCSVPENLKDFITVTSWVQDESVNIYPGYPTGKYLLLPSGELFVFNVDAADGLKSFACRVTSKVTNKAETSRAARLLVREPGSAEPIQLGVRQDVTIRGDLGADVHLPCAASQGNPPPSYAWLKEIDGVLTELSSMTSKYRRRPGGLAAAQSASTSGRSAGPYLITGLRNEDAGYYVCRLNNSVSQMDVRVRLNVFAPLRVQLAPGSQVVDVGRSANFRCLVSGSPIDSIQWYKDGVRIVVGEASLANRYKIGPREVLTVEGVEAQDAGMFQCFASNRVQTAQDSAQLRLGSVLPELTYRFTEQTLQTGPSVSFKCTAVGNPPPQFQWTLDGFAIPENERFLVGQYVTIHDNVISHVNITSVRGEDGGLFTCTAANAVGSVRHSARLNVYGPPFIRHVAPIKAVAGKRLQISCPVSGHPIDNIWWERGGTSLPVNRQQRVYPNGTLIVDNVQRGDDDGVYTCHAKNRIGLTASRDLQVQVVVPPKIMPFQFLSDYLREGRRLAVSCQILEGDKPLDFTWQFQGKPIATSAGITVRIPDEYSTTLVIDSLTSAHNGEYTCIAENPAGKELHTALLTVNVPPKWTLEPHDINVSAGQLITVQCSADGHPAPSITWKRASGSQPGDYRDIPYAGPVYESNGTIRFEDIRKSDEGQYLCEARNDVGSGLSKVIFIKVNAPAEFIDRDQEISVKAGDKAILPCKARGDVPIEVQWSYKHSKIVPHGSSRYSIRHQDMEDGIQSELLITSTSRSDGGLYHCKASNSFGGDQTSVTLKVQEPPEQPSSLRLVEEQSRSIQISWSESFNGNSPLINFIIQYKFPSETWTEAEVEEVAIPATQTTAMLPGLAPSTTYHVRVVAQNGMGFSKPSDVIQVTTAEEAPEGPPTDVHVEALSSTRLKVRWAPPEKHLWHGNILGYYLGYRELGLALESQQSSASSSMLVVEPPGHRSDMHGYHFKTVEVGSGFGGLTTLENLKKYARYAIVVQTFNAKGAGPMSTPAVGVTDQDVPSDPPEKIQCSATSSQSLQVMWEEPKPEGRNGVVQGYKVVHQVSDEGDWATAKWYSIDGDSSSSSSSDTIEEQAPAETKVTTLRSTTVHTLRKWTNYSVSVLAFTSMGDGKLSEPVLCETDEDVPSPPAALKAMVSSRRSVLISWLPPLEPNGVVKHYTLYHKGQDAKTATRTAVDGKEHQFEVIGLKEGQSYEFWLTASTKIGEGPSTSRLGIQASNKVPAKIASFSQKVKIPWKRDLVLRCNSVGIPEPAVVWRFNGKNYMDSSFSNSEQVKTGSGATVDTLKLTAITPDHAGNYTCSVSNQLGSDDIRYEVQVLVPPKPPLLNVMEVFFDSVRLSWTVDDNGGSVIKGFVINYKREGGDWEEYKLRDGTNNHILQGLICGSKYQLFITAFNKIGTGKPSEMIQVKTKGMSPTMPKKDDVISGNSSMMILTFDWWRDVNCPVQRFTVDHKPSGQKRWEGKQTVMPSGKLLLQGLSPNTKYDVQITAINHAGSSVANYTYITESTTLGLEGRSNGLDLLGMSDGERRGHHETGGMSTSLLIVLPTMLAVVAVLGVIGVVVYFRKKRGTPPQWLVGGPKNADPGLRPDDDLRTATLRPGGGLQQLFMDVQQGRGGGGPGAGANGQDQYYIIKTSQEDQLLREPTGDPRSNGRYKPGGGPMPPGGAAADYMDDICPYATFQLPEKPPLRPLLTHGAAPSMPPPLPNDPQHYTLSKRGSGGGGTSKKYPRHTGDTLYSSGNIYSGPYHSVGSSAGYLYNHQATLPIRDLDYPKDRKLFSAAESELLMSATDAEVNKIMSLHMALSGGGAGMDVEGGDYDTLGSDYCSDVNNGDSSALHLLHSHQLPSLSSSAGGPLLTNQNSTSTSGSSGGGSSGGGGRNGGGGLHTSVAALPPHLHQQQLLLQQQLEQQHHEMVIFRGRQRSDRIAATTSEVEQSSSSTESSPTGGSSSQNTNGKYLNRSSKTKSSKSSVQSNASSSGGLKQRVRSSSGYSSHTEETSFSMYDRIQPPTRFSDPHELEAEHISNQHQPPNYGSIKRSQNKARQQQHLQQPPPPQQPRKGNYHIDV